MNRDKFLGRHYYLFNPQDNGGESFSLTTEFYDNGDGVPEGIYTNQKLSLGSYGNSSSFNLTGFSITPEILRELANQLDKVKVGLK